jgi:hypothetical protein
MLKEETRSPSKLVLRLQKLACIFDWKGNYYETVLNPFIKL